MFALIVLVALVIGILAGIPVGRLDHSSRIWLTFATEIPLLEAAIFIVLTSTFGRWTDSYGHAFFDFVYTMSVVVVGIYIGKWAGSLYRGWRTARRDRQARNH
jgi:hypothetical protein